MVFIGTMGVAVIPASADLMSIRRNYRKYVGNPLKSEGEEK